jgi:hypothetical protein
MVVTGAITGTYPCGEPPYVLQGDIDTGAFAAMGMGEIGHPNAGFFGLSAVVDYPPTAATYDYSSDPAGAVWAIDFSNSTGDDTPQNWKGGGGDIDTQTGGTCSLTFTSAALRSDGQSYGVHGTWRATVPAEVASGAQGEISVVLTF